MKELYQWIKLFFWLKKKKNQAQVTDFWTKYSNEFTDSIRSSVGYDDQIPALWTLWNNMFSAIEHYHNWHNEVRTEEFKPLRLDISHEEVDAYNAKGFGMTLEEYQNYGKELNNKNQNLDIWCYTCDWCDEDIVGKEGYGFRYSSAFHIPELCKLEYDDAEKHLCLKCVENLKEALNNEN